MTRAPHIPDDILALALERGGVDFRRYRRCTVERRVQAYARRLGVASLEEFLERVEQTPNEIDRLIAYVTIKVSRFNRNAEVFDLLRARVLPGVIRTGQERPVYVWSAGCGNGEEAYSLAILLAQIIGNDPWPDVAVVATDVDVAALDRARAGVYLGDALVEVSPELTARHFSMKIDRRGPSYTVDPALRSRVQFLRHDLTAADEPPLGLRFHLVCCRNVLIYFDASVQERVQKLLLGSLEPGGYLCLGEAERLSPSLQDVCEVIDRRARVYRLIGGEPWFGGAQ